MEKLLAKAEPIRRCCLFRRVGTKMGFWSQEHNQIQALESLDLVI